jgi:hypothetical protein
MSRYRTLLLAFFLCMAFISCEDAGLDTYSYRSTLSSEHSRGFRPPPRITQPAVFPNMIGSQWKYAISGITGSLITRDTTGIPPDTVTVTVVDSLRLSDGELALEWRYHFLHDFYANYVVTRGDSIFFTSSMNSPSSEDLRLIFPLSDGNSWSSGCCYSVEVYADNEIPVPPDTTLKGFDIVQTDSQPNSYETIEHRFIPHIGFVQVNIRTHCTVCSPGFSNTTWKLLNYTIK